MKKILSLLALSSLMLMAVPASAEDIVGEGSGDIPVNGTLGADNTKEDAPILEGEDSWINVSLPTSTIFYSAGTESGTEIKSPKYTITNNSGRPVDIYFNQLAENVTDTTGINYDLNLSGFGSSEFPIRTGTSLVTTPSSSELIRLANTNGKLTKDGNTTNPKAVEYEYTGTVNQELSGVITHNYNMTLEFKSVSW